ncbi:MAG: DsbA family protein [Bdellovibrionales bacterium]
MKFVKYGLATTIFGLLLSLAAPSYAETSLSGAQKKEVEDVVRTLLLEKEPDLIIKAAEEMQKRAEKESREQGAKAVQESQKELINDSDDPVIGNKKGDVTIVEFFDYNCGYCKVVLPTLQELIKKDPKVRIVMKEYPILGNTSEYAAKAALASVNQNKYMAFHDALMGNKQHLTEALVIGIAKRAGLDTDKLKKDMESDKIAKIISKTRDLGEKVGARGTPTFIIGGKIFPGAVPLEQMQEEIKKIRDEKKKK